MDKNTENENIETKLSWLETTVKDINGFSEQLKDVVEKVESVKIEPAKIPGWPKGRKFSINLGKKDFSVPQHDNGFWEWKDYKGTRVVFWNYY